MDPVLHSAIGSLIYHPASLSAQPHLFLANFGAVSYGDDGDDGAPVGMTVDRRFPTYRSGKMADYAGLAIRLTLDDMWYLLDEADRLRKPDWVRWTFGLPMCVAREPRLLVPSRDGRGLLCAELVGLPEVDTESESDGYWDEEDSDMDQLHHSWETAHQRCPLITRHFMASLQWYEFSDNDSCASI